MKRFVDYLLLIFALGFLTIALADVLAETVSTNQDRRYLNEALEELTNTINSAAFKDQTKPGAYLEKRPEIVAYRLKSDALGKIAKAAGPSAIKFVAPLLFSTEPVPRGGDDVINLPIPFLAACTLYEMKIDGAPTSSSPFSVKLPEWQKWWEQNKGYYEKLEFGTRSSPQTLEQRGTHEELSAKIQKGDQSAILEAGKTGDKSFIPVLESIARPHYVAQIDTNSFRNMNPQQVEMLKNTLWHPVYDDPVAVNARKALAKLGVKEYLDEILLELTDPTSSPLYKEREEHRAFRYNPIRLRGEAFRKLAYIKDRSTVRTIASFLPITSEPVMDVDVIYDSYSNLAMQTLAQIVDNPPQINLPVDSETLETRSKIWQQWWEQNKDKYP